MPQPLAVDTVPGYTGKTPIPPCTSATWKYRAISRRDDERAGSCSDTVSITAEG